MQQQDKKTGRRLKYATALDLRRGCAHRLINAGVSAETLKVILRYNDFATTENFYGASKAAQAAATDVSEKLVSVCPIYEFTDPPCLLSPEVIQKLKIMLNWI